MRKQQSKVLVPSREKQFIPQARANSSPTNQKTYNRETAVINQTAGRGAAGTLCFFEACKVKKSTVVHPGSSKCTKKLSHQEKSGQLPQVVRMKSTSPFPTDTSQGVPFLELEILFIYKSECTSVKDTLNLTGAKIGERLKAEAECNLAINVVPVPGTDSFEVQGRGEMQLGILIENMRREGFELSVSPPKVMYKTENGERLEPLEEVTIEVNEEHVGIVMEALSHRRGELIDMGPCAGSEGRSRLSLICPSRGLVGYRSVFSADTRGTGFYASCISKLWKTSWSSRECEERGI
ncbi:hypothetical protein KI387_043327, partial [Taxus chinensis]